MKVVEIINHCERLTLELNKKSSGKPLEKHIYSGYEIGDFLKQQMPFHQVEFYAEDGFALALSEKEACQCLLLADCVDGKPISIKEGLTLVIPTDSTSRRWCKYILEIEVKY